MIREATPFLNFNGDCGAAIALYEQALGAVVEVRSPWDPAMFEGPVPEAMRDGVMYARLKVGDAPLEMSDVPPDMTVSWGTAGSVNLHFDDPDQLDRCFAALAEGGQIQMPVETMFWGARFGKLADRFGVQWMFHCQLES